MVHVQKSHYQYACFEPWHSLQALPFLWPFRREDKNRNKLQDMASSSKGLSVFIPSTLVLKVPWPLFPALYTCLVFGKNGSLGLSDPCRLPGRLKKAVVAQLRSRPVSRSSLYTGLRRNPLQLYGPVRWGLPLEAAPTITDTLPPTFYPRCVAYLRGRIAYLVMLVDKTGPSLVPNTACVVSRPGFQ